MVKRDVFGIPIMNRQPSLVDMAYGNFGSQSERGTKKRKPIHKNIKEWVWNHYNQNSLAGKCYVCKRPITHENFDLGHNKAVAKGGNDDVSNLRPICRPCNSAMGTMTIEAYKAKYFGGKKPVSKESKAHTTRKPRPPREQSIFGAPLLFGGSRKSKTSWGF